MESLQLCARRLLLQAALLIPLLTAWPAQAANDCRFAVNGSTWTLLGDCSTDSTLFVPEGVTLDGQGYTIRANNPSTGSFQGAVVQNQGTVAHVVSLRIVGENLAGPCATGEARLKGIALSKASGSILSCVVEGIHRGTSVCEEGNAIDVSNPPYDGTHPASVSVTLAGNHVSGYQKTGIAINGDVIASVQGNQIGRAFDAALVAANSLQLGYGARGDLRENVLEGNEFNQISEPQLFSTAMLVYQAAQARLMSNVTDGEGTDVGVAIFESSSIHVVGSTLGRTTDDADVVDAYGVGLWFSGNTGLLRLGKNTFNGWNDSVRFDSSTAKVLTLCSPYRP